jgi:hypothetical protein
MDDNNCYRFEKHTYTDGMFNSTIDATYIIHLEGNGRIESIKKQLEEYHPTNTVYIVFNKGFKKCNKLLKVQSSMYDLTHANLEVFKHSKMNKYSNILVLEDDFIFNKDIKLQIHQNNINNFLKNNDNKPFIYHLGALPVVILPYNSYTYYSACLTTHASIFTSSAQDYIINFPIIQNVPDWDFFLLNNISRYLYYTPLCYQTFPQTENKSNWNQLAIIAYITDTFIAYTKFDTEVEPATTYVYIFAKIFSFIIFIFILYIIWLLLSYFEVFKLLYKVFKGYRLKR